MEDEFNLFMIGLDELKSFDEANGQLWQLINLLVNSHESQRYVLDAKICSYNYFTVCIICYHLHFML